MLIPARQWIRETFVPGARVPLKKVEQWVRDGDIPGQIIGVEVYVDDSFATNRPGKVKPRTRIDLLA
jgi:hypothetical protein